MAESNVASLEFRKLVEQYAGLSDEIAASGKTLRELRKKAKEFGDSILEFMCKNDIEEIEVAGNGKIKRRVSKRTAPLNKDLIVEELKTHVTPENADEIVEKILLRREQTETTSLKRVKK